MEAFYNPRSKSTPEILFRPETSIFLISGNSYPENPERFYSPVLNWMKEYTSNIEIDNLTINFEFIYFNTATSMEIIKLLKLLKRNMHDKEVVINWHYNLEDADLLQSGQRFELLSKMKFKYTVTELR